ncbi:MAG: hypothetical protein BWX77_00138 [Bacteroidetes bacterium ADurb.Bin090]|nr:MAG: hypothetical protein BWX77_00138 [Bacteroidetes bacterium ADurb.Bin090]
MCQKISYVFFSVAGGILVYVCIGISVHAKIVQIICRHQRHFIGKPAAAVPKIIKHISRACFLSFRSLPFFGGDDNHTIRTFSTIQRCSRSIFQNVDRGNVVRIQHVDSIIHHHIINHIDGALTKVNGVGASYFDCSIGPRLGVFFYIYSRNFALQRLVDVGCREFFQFFACYTCCSAC